MGHAWIVIYDQVIGSQVVYEKKIFFHMVENKFIVKLLIKFHKMITDLQNIEVKIKDEDKVILLLSSLLKKFEHFKDSLLYVNKNIIPFYGNKDTIKFDEVQTTVRSNNLSNTVTMKHLSEVFFTHMAIWQFLVKEYKMRENNKWIVEIQNLVWFEKRRNLVYIGKYISKKEKWSMDF